MTAMARLIIAAVLLLPLAEIVTFIAVAALIGVGTAFLLMLATSLLGFVLLRRAGRSGLAHLRAAMDGLDVDESHRRGPEHLLTIVAGVLLVVPGFLTDLVGAALLMPAVRRLCGNTARHWLHRRQPGGPSTVDLAPGEWRQVPDREISNDSSRRRE
jgi:UPF0716 protein FxsA